LVSEIIHGTPSRFSDPARFAFAHGGKNAKPFPVLTNVYDETINFLQQAVEKARIGDKDKSLSMAKLTSLAQKAEAGFEVKADFQGLLDKENREAPNYGGRRVTAKRPKPQKKDDQLSLF
jgi:hypothetical protein